MYLTLPNQNFNNGYSSKNNLSSICRRFILWLIGSSVSQFQEYARAHFLHQLSASKYKFGNMWARPFSSHPAFVQSNKVKGVRGIIPKNCMTLIMAVWRLPIRQKLQQIILLIIYKRDKYCRRSSCQNLLEVQRKIFVGMKCVKKRRLS